MLLVAVTFMLFPTAAAAEELADVVMWIEAYPDHAGRVRIFTQKAYRENLSFTKDIIYVPFVNGNWDPELRIETEGPVSAEYIPGNITIKSTGPGHKVVKIWFTAQGALLRGPLGDRIYSVGWVVRPDFAELGRTQVQARVVFPLGTTPAWGRNGIRVGTGEVLKVSERWADLWLIDEVLRPGTMAEIEVAYRVPSATVSNWMVASLSLSLTACVLALWTATRRRDIGSP